MDCRDGPDTRLDAGPSHRLVVYVMTGCPGWSRARQLASLITDAGIAGLDVTIIDLATITTPLPTSVIASPTWLLDGKRIALGNPDPDWLLAHLNALPTGD